MGSRGVARTATPDVLLAPTEVVVTVVPSPAVSASVHSAEVVVPLPRPTVDIGSIPNGDRPRDEGPRSLHDQLVRCLSFSLSKQDYGPITDRHIVRVEVHARNSCSDAAFVGEEAWFEVRARDRAGRVVARERGQFQSPIRPLGEAVTFVDIAATIEDRLEASVY